MELSEKYVKHHHNHHRDNKEVAPREEESYSDEVFQMDRGETVDGDDNDDDDDVGIEDGQRGRGGRRKFSKPKGAPKGEKSRDFMDIRIQLPKTYGISMIIVCMYILPSATAPPPTFWKNPIQYELALFIQMQKCGEFIYKHHTHYSTGSLSAWMHTY